MSAFKKGDRVKHPEYGEGIVVVIDSIGNPGVAFDQSHPLLHALDGACADLHGYWAAPDNLTMVAMGKYTRLAVEVNPAPSSTGAGQVLPSDIIPDNTNPDHYKRGGTETIDYLRAKMSEEEFKGFCRGNALKYISRAPDKNGDEDYRKAIWYLRMLVGDDPRKV